MPTSASEALASVARKETLLLDLTRGTNLTARQADSDRAVIDRRATTERTGQPAPALERR